MSYADVAAKGPKQSPEEVSQHPHRRAPPVPSLSQSESEVASLIDVDSPHVSSVKSDFQEQEIKTETQAERIEHELEDKARAEVQNISEGAESAKKKAASKGKQFKDVMKKDGQKLSENRDNPVVIGNAIIWGIATLAIGYGAYQKHTEGKLDWQLAGSVAAGVGAFAVADYFGSKWLLENKYPPK
ncbi:uncharacterized protein Z519_08911 [Cladophialophora bantiana CBS 173.52]|uniref:Mitochondrial outer membrane protein OM14 C-terminal domain-containing protein n=1 Tax=Cladophialophora bantiana (strain ATCC 10958 / CBS 173.52 / CDC B-1940 / NIH 8579) TaxID=1442370 RepID=A0A0D2FUP1_CLAB1|nr:uncharacterized protein Z519_08911 [Cladophialophora bantiana CBS 173.52]KIW90267.1 hypothetical protein Z519_08911 [Cladophialophora bantiana CBS 173.52]